MNQNLKDNTQTTQLNGLTGISMPEFVGVIYSDVKREYFPTESQYLTEKDALKNAEIIANYLEKLGIKVSLYAGNAELPAQLRRDNPDLVFNFVDSVEGYEYLSSTIPGVLELLDIPYTGAGILGSSLDFNKFIIKKLFEQNGVPVPRYQLFNSYSDLIDSKLRFPLISKLNEIHGSVEITKDAVSENENHLRERLKFLIKTYDQSVLVEEFIVGQEIVGYLIEGINKKVYLAERVFHQKNNKYTLASFEDKWTDDNYLLSHFEKFVDPILIEYIKKAFDTAKMSDYGKFDVIIDRSGRYYFIDSNCNPEFGPKETSSAIADVLELYNVTFLDILKKLITNTLSDIVKEQSAVLNNINPLTIISAA